MLNNTGKLETLCHMITLWIRENSLYVKTNGTTNDNSKDLIKTSLDIIKNNKNKMFGADHEITLNLASLMEDMLTHPDSYDQEIIVSSLENILSEKENIKDNLIKNIKADMDIGSLKRTTRTLRNNINNFYGANAMISLMNKTSYVLNNNQLGDKNIADLKEDLENQLAAINLTSKKVDKAIVDNVDLGDDSNLMETIKKAKASNEGGSVLKTGWKEWNKATGGGHRRNEMCMIGALQHKYKSGTSQSLFMHFPMYNKPVMDNKDKKPLILYISGEDNTTTMIQFIYKKLYYDEHGTLPNFNEVSDEEITKYIKYKLGVNGYHVKIIKVVPENYTYRKLFNLILDLESEGFEIHACIIDYLTKLSTAGCITGPTGTDYRDLYQRCRSFFTSKNIALITPQQLSTEAKQLIRNGVAPKDFVKEIEGKGYTADSKQLDQVVDLEMYQHLAYIGREWYLTVQRGKHRNPKIIPEEDKYFMLKFDKDAPLKDNLNTEDKKEDTLDDVSDNFEF
jgi:hypothetical protein